MARTIKAIQFDQSSINRIIKSTLGVTDCLIVFNFVERKHINLEPIQTTHE